MSCVFFFQAEDGIRDLIVTGVQTCALPIWPDQESAARPARCRWPAPPRGAPRRLPCRRHPRRAAGLRRDRKSVVEGKSGDLGGRRIIKKKKEERGSLSERAVVTQES